MVLKFENESESHFFKQNINKKTLPFPGKLNLATKMLFLSSIQHSKKELWNNFSKLDKFKDQKL